MHYETFDETIEVIVHFGTQKVKPIRFLWRGQAHQVKTVRGQWTTLEGRRKCLHWAVMANGVGPCELSLNVDDMSWRINSVAIES